MNELFTKSWRSLALRGIVSLLFGVLAAFWPGITLMWLLVIFGAYALIAGGRPPLPLCRTGKPIVMGG